MMTLAIPKRLGVSTITFRHRPLEEALRLIRAAGAHRIDLGAIPEVTDHIPVPFTSSPKGIAALVEEAGLTCGAVNCNPGDLNDPDLPDDNLRAIISGLAELAAACGAALIVPAGRSDWEPFMSEAEDVELIARRLRLVADVCTMHDVRLLVEVLHHRRFVHTVAQADALLEACGPSVFGLLFDVSHIVASDEDPVAWLESCSSRIERVHLRDAVPGNLNLSLGTGDVPFDLVIDRLEKSGFNGDYILELETHDVQEQDREADLQRSLELVSGILASPR